MEKAKLNHMYPCLLPKSYQELKLNPHVQPLNGPCVYNVDCQVSMISLMMRRVTFLKFIL